jgi:GNAT superfamily N-acetyltransferase
MSVQPRIDVRAVGFGATISDWLTVLKTVMRGDPAWISPLDLVEKQRISAKHNPFFKFGEARFFVAYCGGQPVGRISAQINRLYTETKGKPASQFGFFDCIDDKRVARALVDHAALWLNSHGLTDMEGPFNLTINQDAGLLVSGFEHRPAIMTSHAPPWAGELLESCGLAKSMELFAYRFQPACAPMQFQRLARLAPQGDRVRVRQLDLSRYREETALIFDIFNDAWSDNWNFIPIKDHEAMALAGEMRPLLRSKFGFIAEVDGRPAAMMIVLPDINDVTTGFRGRLLPFNWAKLALSLWNDNWRTARVPLLGVRKEFRGDPIAVQVISKLMSEVLKLSKQYDLKWTEISWILETNRQMVQLAEIAAGKPARIYRIYRKEI